MSAEPLTRSGDDFDLDRAFKLPREARYFNISVLWIFYYPWLLRALYRLGIRHEAVTLVSLASGILSGIMLLRSGYPSLVFAALFAHIKDVFDACDGSLARLRRQTNRIARFLDSLSDFVAISWIVVALAIRLYPSYGPVLIGLAVLTWLSLFVQCSYFNFYLVSYTKLFRETNVRLDERLTDADVAIYSVLWKRYMLISLQSVYRVVYGWQDRLVAALDRRSARKVLGETPESLGFNERRVWYGEKILQTLNSPLCFGTHLFILILSALLSHPEFFYYFVLIPGNAYLLFNYVYRERRVTRRIAGREPATA